MHQHRVDKKCYDSGSKYFMAVVDYTIHSGVEVSKGSILFAGENSLRDQHLVLTIQSGWIPTHSHTFCTEINIKMNLAC